jgi:hypothetical protein
MGGRSAWSASRKKKLLRGGNWLRHSDLTPFGDPHQVEESQICAIEFLHALEEDSSTQRMALAVAAALDFLGTKGAATAAVLIIQIGIENVCAGHWEQYVQ